MEILKAKSGEIHIKMPNIIELPRFLGKLNLTGDNKKELDRFELFALVIENLESLIKKIDVKKGKKKIEKYEELFDMKEWQRPLYAFANKLINSFNEVVADKKKE